MKVNIIMLPQAGCKTVTIVNYSSVSFSREVDRTHSRELSTDCHRCRSWYYSLLLQRSSRESPAQHQYVLLGHSPADHHRRRVLHAVEGVLRSTWHHSTLRRVRYSGENRTEYLTTVQSSTTSTACCNF